jgi:hypothetical protein
MIDVKLETFKGQLKDGARPNKFAVSITGNQGVAGAQWIDEPFSYFVKSFSIPSRTIGEVLVNFMGLTTKLSGDGNQVDDCTMITHVDYDYTIKKYFEKWMEGILSIGADGENIRSAPSQYKAQVTVEQLGRSGEVLATYILHGAFPKQMDAIELSHENQDVLEELSITLAYDYWTTI